MGPGVLGLTGRAPGLAWLQRSEGPGLQETGGGGGQMLWAPRECGKPARRQDAGERDRTEVGGLHTPLHPSCTEHPGFGGPPSYRGLALLLASKPSLETVLTLSKKFLLCSVLSR